MPSRTVEEIRRETEASRQRREEEVVTQAPIAMQEPVREPQPVSAEEQERRELVEMVKESGTRARPNELHIMSLFLLWKHMNADRFLVKRS